MLVFISWSGDRSRAIAEQWEQILRPVIQGVQVFWSPRIKAGRRQWDELSSALANGDLGIICVTPDNKEKPWLMFEAGALSKRLPESRVCTCLHELDSGDLKDSPLGQFQHSPANEAGVRQILETINEALGEAALSRETLSRLFKKFWPDFKRGLQQIPKKGRRAKRARRRTEADKLDQIIALLQEKESAEMTADRGGTVATAMTVYPSPIARDFRNWLGGFRVALHRYKQRGDNLEEFSGFNRGIIQFVKRWEGVLPENLRLEILKMPKDFDLFPEYQAAGTVNEVLDRLYAHAATIYDRMS